MKLTLGWFTRYSPTSWPRPLSRLSAPGGNPARRAKSMNRAAMTPDCSAGFMITVLPATSAATVMPQRIASGKIPGRDDQTPTPRGRYSWTLFSPGHGKRGLRAAQTAHLGGVEIAKVDGFGDVAVGFDPGFADLENLQGGEFEAFGAHEVGHLLQHAGATFHRHGAPDGRDRQRGFDGGLRLPHRCLGDASDHLVGPARVNGVQPLGGGDALIADDQRMILTEAWRVRFPARDASGRDSPPARNPPGDR